MKELCESLDKSETPQTVLVVSHSFALITFLKKLTAPNEFFQLSNWNQETDFKMMKNASYMKILVEKKNGSNPSSSSSSRDLYFDVKHFSDHLINQDSAANGVYEGSFSKFTQVTADAKEFSGCVQQ